ncbi:MAG: hypothetical protein MUC62_03965 [Candidatus Thermoplasmatota archaeon]|nr:hypothetical protein [Candidatus Thermoplasmatota archaeon]
MSREIRRNGTRDIAPLKLVLKGIRWLFSFLLALVGGILFFLGLSMLIIFLIDSVVFDHSPYINWLPNVYLPVVASLLCFFVFALLNLDRFKTIRTMTDRFRAGRRSAKVDEIDLD